MASGPADVPCVPNPDVAGLGVIAAFVAAALLTFMLSFICGCLKLKVTSPAGNTPDLGDTRRLRGRSTYARIKYLLNDRPREVAVADSRTTQGLWHCILSSVLLGLGMNQLVAGFALYISAIAKYGAYSTDPHAVLAYSLSSLSMFSQLQAPFVLQRSVWLTSMFRSYILYFYVLVLFITTAVGFKTTKDVADLVAAILSLYGSIFSMYIAASEIDQGRVIEKAFDKAFQTSQNTVLQKIRLSQYITSRLNRYQSVHRFISRHPLVQFLLGFVVCAGFTIWYLVRVLRLKFDKSATHGCNLDSSAENEWTLGQIFTVLMLVALLLPATEAYFGEFQNHNGKTSASTTSEPRPSLKDTAEVHATEDDANATALSEISLSHENLTVDHSTNDPESNAMQKVKDSKNTSSSAVQSHDDIDFEAPTRRTTTRLESQD